MSKKDDGRRIAETSAKILAPTITAGVGAAVAGVGATIASAPLLPIVAGVGLAVGLWTMFTSDDK
jgi:spermidine/putrescine-binding protein